MKHRQVVRNVLLSLCTGISLFLSTGMQAQSGNVLQKLELPDYVTPQQFGFASGNIDDPAIGRQLFRRLRQHRRLIEDPELTGWIQALTWRLSRTMPGIAKHLHIAIENNPEINAHVLHGGIILVNSGLILNSDSTSPIDDIDVQG